MKVLATQLILIFTLISTQFAFAQNEIQPDDLALILGEWKGSLTYMDYSSNEPFSMPAGAIIKQGKNENQLNIQFTYPNEPKANSKGKITISKDGLHVNKARVISRKVLENNEIQITTESEGKDNNKKALIRKVYILGSSRFISRKEVKFNDSDDWLVRNEYEFLR